MTNNLHSASTQVNAYLREMRKDYSDSGTLKSALPVIDRLLESGSNKDGMLSKAWSELLRQYLPDDKSWQMVVDTFVDTAALNLPHRNEAMRDALTNTKNPDSIVNMNSSIAKKARQLADLLRARREKAVEFAVAPPSGDYPLALLGPAAWIAGNEVRARYSVCVEDHIDRLPHPFDDRYWPITADMLEALAEDAEEYFPQPGDAIASASMESREKGPRNSLRAIDEALALCRAAEHVEFSPGAYAAITNAALGLDEHFSAASIEQYRREINKHSS